MLHACSCWYVLVLSTVYFCSVGKTKRKIDQLDSASLRRAELQRGAAFGRVAHNSAAA